MLPGVSQARKKDGTIYYRSGITFRGKHISLGSYPGEGEAHRAYHEAGELLSGTCTLEELIERYTVAFPSEQNTGRNPPVSAERDCGRYAAVSTEENTGKNLAATSEEDSGKNPAATSEEDSGKNPAATSEEDSGKNPAATSEEDSGKNPAATSEEDSGKNPAATSEEDSGKNPAATSEEDSGKNLAATSEEDSGKNPAATSEEDSGKNLAATSEEDSGKNALAVSEKSAGEESPALGFEKVVSLLNFRDHQMYIPTPIYMRKNYFSYYLAPWDELKFDIDDLFYYSQHKIMRRKGHLFVNDYGMQVTILGRFGIKSHAVCNRDYEFANGDPTDLRYANIIVINRYHGVTCMEKNNRKRYRVRIHINGNYTVGSYSSEESAAVAYNKAVDLAHKAGVDRNYPQNYVESLTAREYAKLYTSVRISRKYLAYLDAIRESSENLTQEMPG